MTAVQVDRAAVFFDRDGVLNQSLLVRGRPYPPASAAELTVEDIVAITGYLASQEP